MAAFLLVGLVLRPSHLGDVLDDRTLRALGTLRSDPDGGAWLTATRLGEPSSYALFCLALVLVAFLRRRPRWALVVPVTMVASELCAHGLKQLLAGPRPGVPAGRLIGDAAWPSGHSTAAMTVALLAVLLAPRRLRPAVAAAGVVGALAVGFGMVVTGSHYPTDIFGGYLCAAIWVTLAGIAVVAWDRRRPVARAPDRAPLRAVDVAGPLLLLVLGVLVAVAAASRDAGGIVAAVRDHTAAVAVAGALVALALTLVTATALAPRVQGGSSGDGTDRS